MSPAARSPWRTRVRVGLAALAVYLLVLGFGLVDGGRPAPLRLALVLALVLGAGGVLVLAASPRERRWRPDATDGAAPPGRDAGYATYLRVLEDHRRAVRPDDALQRRLRDLADQRLRSRHGLDHRDPRAATLLGADVLERLTGPPRRLRPDQVEDVVTRIEEL